jgi:hypothetical protein
MSTHPIFLRSVSILSSHLSLNLSNAIYFLSSTSATCPAHLILLDFIILLYLVQSSTYGTLYYCYYYYYYYFLQPSITSDLDNRD